jgi:hypothetical protein
LPAAGARRTTRPAATPAPRTPAATPASAPGTPDGGTAGTGGTDGGASNDGGSNGSDGGVPAATIPPGTTVWYVRPDGGSRYSANATDGQCDGLADVAYPGSGTNQHCAFGDYRYLYSDKSYNNSAWVIAGGDAVVLRGGPWRVGSDMTGSVPGGAFCAGIGNDCSSPPIPSGTTGKPTRIYGENYGSCSARTQIFGSRGVGAIFTLNGSSYVDLDCLELTDHAQCSQTGSPQLPSTCTYRFWTFTASPRGR